MSQQMTRESLAAQSPPPPAGERSPSAAARLARIGAGRRGVDDVVFFMSSLREVAPDDGDALHAGRAEPRRRSSSSVIVSRL